MKVLYYDCFSGISGDMNLGALLDLGVSKTHLKQELSKLSLKDAFTLHIDHSSKMGIHGTKVYVEMISKHHTHSHEHRTYQDIQQLIRESSLSESVKKRSIDIFWELAVAEGKIHSTDPLDVCFHEVGAVDSIVDIVGAAICLEALAVDHIIASKVELGSGFVQCAHGILPVPAPATLELLRDVPITLGRVDSEATTPTGAAILKANVTSFEDKPSFKIQKIGYGIGHRDFTIPNVLRVFLGEMEEQKDSYEECVLETNIDDMSPEVLAYVHEKLFLLGAKDVYTTPIVTKKNRLGTKLSVLVSKEREEEAIRLIFEETSSIGLRRYHVDKIALKRSIMTLATPYGNIDIKCSFYEGKFLKYKAEYEMCKQASIAHKVPISTIYESVAQCFNEQKKNV